MIEPHEAELLRLQYQKFGSWFNEIGQISMQLKDKEFAKQLRLNTAEMLFQLDDSLRVPLSKIYPDRFTIEDDGTLRDK